jgi:hypothetical protein
MGTGAVYRKTDLGQAEVGARKLKLNPRLRTMLILIDGEQDEPTMREEAEKIGAQPDFLEQLVRMGLVERVREAAMASTPANAPHMVGEFERVRMARGFMNAAAVDCLGMKSFFFTLKLEAVANMADLRQLAPDFQASIAKAKGDAHAAAVMKRLNSMIG